MTIPSPFCDIKSLEDLIPFSKWAKPSIAILQEHMVYDAGHDEGHLLRVAKNALWFGQDGDADVIVPAALLHDLVNIPKDDPKRNQASRMSASKAINYLRSSIGFKGDDHLLNISNSIAAHSYSAQIEPLSLEAKAVQDADRIEALGQIGLTRLFAVCGSMNRTLFHPTDPLALNREIDESSYGLDHFMVKLANLCYTMQTPLGKNLAEERTRKMYVFIADLIDEL